MNTIKKSYDEIPYDSKVFKESLPENLYFAGLLYGLKAPKVGSARVLELACSTGGNIIPFALNHKDAKVIGVDLSSLKIQKAKNLAKKLGASNIEFYEKNILDIDKSFGEFDYIIAHGLYNWVNDEIKDKIFKIFDECLALEGIAYVSYDTYPGWKGKEILKDIMLFRMQGKDQNDANSKIELGFDTLSFLKNNAIPGVSKTAIDEHFYDIKSKNSSYFLHEYFEYNKPEYFYQVVERARKHNLEFLCEANYKSSIFPPINENLKRVLNAECSGDRVKFEQFIDFITDKTFRKTLFVKKEFANQIDTGLNIKFKDLDKFFISGKFVYDANKQLYQSLETNNFMPKNMFLLFEELSEIYPSNLSIGEFMSEYKKSHNDDEVREFYLNLAFLLVTKDLNFSFESCKFDKEIKKKPKINEVNLKLLEFIKNKSKMTGFFNKFYDNIALNKDVDYEFLPLFDGKRNADELANELIKLQDNDKFKFILEGEVITSKKMINLMAKRYTKQKIDALFTLGVLE